MVTKAREHRFPQVYTSRNINCEHIMELNGTFKSLSLMGCAKTPDGVFASFKLMSKEVGLSHPANTELKMSLFSMALWNEAGRTLQSPNP